MFVMKKDKKEFFPINLHQFALKQIYLGRMNWMKICVNLFVYIMFDCILYVMLTCYVYVVSSSMLDTYCS